MKNRFDTTLISEMLLSLCLAVRIPQSLGFASTWKELYFEAAGFKQQNLLMPLGFYSLGIEIIGFIVLWTGYRRKNPSAWFVMLIIFLFALFPSDVLPVLLQAALAPEAFTGITFSSELKAMAEGTRAVIGLAVGLLDFLIALVALLLPSRAFFWKSTNARDGALTTVGQGPGLAK